MNGETREKLGQRAKRSAAVRGQAGRRARAESTEASDDHSETIQEWGEFPHLPGYQNSDFSAICKEI